MNPMKIETPYHDGELQVQERVGVLHEGAQNARVIQDSIIKGALRFIGQLPMAVFGSLDQEEKVWASVFLGKPGFIQAEDERMVKVDITAMGHNPYDPFWKNIQKNPEVGMLAIELASRRRLRINGTITRASDALLQLQVKESYPNCPKYIQRRQVSTPQQGADRTPLISAQGDVLDSAQRTMIKKADTFFVASVHPERGVDASHRGGNPGFVTLLDDRTLRIPDYPGNSMFNTLGNFAVNPRAGLIFLDFEAHRTLQLTGQAEILYDVDGTKEETGGTNRHWQFHIDRWVEITHAPQSDWSLLDYSPYNPPVSLSAEN
jgi:predicted pyridoxine 5'-phosphate oxidase superfamily flavin-nucleotide-binding protein